MGSPHRHCAIVVATLLGVGCGGEVSWSRSAGSGGDASASATHDADSRANDAGHCSPPPSGPTDLVVPIVDEKDQPIAGAIVVLDRPNGIREEKVTSSDGSVTFSNVDFASGSFDLTAFSPDRVMRTIIAVEPTSSRLIGLHRRSYQLDQAKQISGKILNKSAAENFVRVSSTTWAEPAALAGDDYELRVPNDATGRIVAFEYESKNPIYSYAGIMRAAIALELPTATTTLDLDLSKSLPIEHASGTLQLPPASAPLGVDPEAVEVRTTSYGSRGALSASILTASASTGDAISWSADFFRPVPEADAITEYRVGATGGCSNTYAGVWHPGYPGEGAPSIPSSSAFASCDWSEPHSLFGPISWTNGQDRAQMLTIFANVHDDGLAVWSISFPAARDNLTLQKPPDSIWSAIDWKDSSDLLALLEYCEPMKGAEPESCSGADPPWGSRCKRWAYSDALGNLHAD